MVEALIIVLGLAVLIEFVMLISMAGELEAQKQQLYGIFRLLDGARTVEDETVDLGKEPGLRSIHGRNSKAFRKT